MIRFSNSLFGGALLAAGMVAPAAQAQSFSFSYSYSFVTAFDAYDGSPSGYQDFFGAGDHSVITSFDGAYGKVDASSAGMSNRSGSFAQDYLGGGLNNFSYFTVDQDTLANVTWDFSADEGPGGTWIDSFLSIQDLSNGAMIFSTDLNNPMGSTQISLDSTHEYFLKGNTNAWDGAGVSYFNLAVPAPGAAGLLSIGGLMAARRRR